MGGAVHTFSSLEDAQAIVKSMNNRLLYYYEWKTVGSENYVIYEVEGTCVIADGIFPCRVWDKPDLSELKSVCFKSVRLIKEVENK